MYEKNSLRLIFLLVIVMSPSLRAADSSMPNRKHIKAIDRQDSFSIWSSGTYRDPNAILSNEELTQWTTFNKEHSLRILIDAYLRNGIDKIGSKQELLTKIAEYVQKDSIEYKNKAQFGHQILSSEYNSSLVKKVYQSGDDALISLFWTVLPKPSSFIFEPGQVPAVIKAEEEQKNQKVMEFIARQPDKKNLEGKVIALQRYIRRQQRDHEQLENTHRILSILGFDQQNRDQKIINNRFPYIPWYDEQSQQMVSDIVSDAVSVDVWPTIRHLTSASYVSSVLDDGIMGRRNLCASYRAFRSAALFDNDIDNGDGNVVCMGPDKIDPRALKGCTIELVFDFGQMKKHNNPVCFFKTHDLGYRVKDDHELLVAKKVFRFNQRNPESEIHRKHYPDLSRGQEDYYGCFKFDGSYFFSPLTDFMYHHSEGLDATIALYVFQFIDRLPQEQSQDIYDHIASLSASERKDFIVNLARKATDTAELNFYGCFLPPLEHLLSVGMFNGSNRVWTLAMDDLINALNKGDVAYLDMMRNEAPQLLKSYRFVSFLLNKVTHSDSKVILIAMLEAIPKPSWYRALYCEQ